MTVKYCRSMEIVSLIGGLLGAAATVVLGIVAFGLSRRASRYSAQRAIGDLANTMAHMRSDHPEIMAIGRHWKASDMAILYGRRASPEASAIVRYYSYVDVGLEFCNTALAARDEGHIPAHVFDRHYRRLIRLFFAENWPYISQTRASQYVSQYVKDELAVAENEGLTWATLHEELAGPPD